MADLGGAAAGPPPGVPADGGGIAPAPAAGVAADDEDVWLFGYGSLIFKHGVPFVEERDCFVEGLVRRFWQGSPDHRGTHEAPGRVVTLLTAEEIARLRPEDELHEIETRTWGVAFRVRAEDMRAEMAKLEYREKAGYDKVFVDAVFPDGSTVSALVFRATPDNDHFLGPRCAEEMAAHIHRSVGPSGPNREYFCKLYYALEAMQERVGEPHDDVLDPHVRAIFAHLPPEDPNDDGDGAASVEDQIGDH